MVYSSLVWFFFMGSSSGSLMMCPSRATALLLIVCENVSNFVVFPFLSDAFSAASRTDLLVAVRSMKVGAIPRHRRRPRCWKASSLL